MKRNKKRDAGAVLSTQTQGYSHHSDAYLQSRLFTSEEIAKQLEDLQIFLEDSERATGPDAAIHVVIRHAVLVLEAFLPADQRLLLDPEPPV